MEECFNSTPPTPVARGRLKLNRNRSPKSPGTSNWKLHVDRMTEQQLDLDIETISKDPTTITITDNNGNENQIKTELFELPNTRKQATIITKLKDLQA